MLSLLLALPLLGACSNTAGAGAEASTSSSSSGNAGTSNGGETASSSGGNASSAAGAADAGVDPTSLDHFSFFVTSLAVLQELSGSQQGFGGKLSFGETGAGAGLRGADKICAAIAERSMPGASSKQWRAFLSAAAGEDGNQVDAIDRIGDGPWYDRLGRMLAPNRASLLQADRPQGGDSTIRDDFPNEDGVPNHAPDPTQGQVDNHDMLTGTNAQGGLFAANATCLDWTANAGNKTLEGKPRVGHAWPRSGPGGPGGPGGGPGGDVSPANWMSALTESGCAPGVSIIEMGPPVNSSNTVGSGGGYGGFYCFALLP